MGARPGRGMRALLLVAALWPALGGGCGAGRPVLRTTDDRQEGLATWYGRAHHGGPTASGERFDMWALTAAHRTLRFGARVLVENLRNGASVVVRINDRGPFTRGRVIDLSYAAATRLRMIRAGVVPVRLRLLAP
jgi:rare lipoprotein A